MNICKTYIFLNYEMSNMLLLTFHLDDVEGFLRRVRESIPIFANINSLMLREMMVESTVHKCAAGDVVFEKNDYTNSFYVVLEGAVAVVLDQGDHEKRIEQRTLREV